MRTYAPPLLRLPPHEWLGDEVTLLAERMEPPASPLHPTPALAFMKEVRRAGPNAGPRMLRDRYYRGDLTVDDLRRVITSVSAVGRDGTHPRPGPKEVPTGD